MKTLDASTVRNDDLSRLEDTVKAMHPDSELAFFLASVAAAVRHGSDVIVGQEADLVSPAQAAKLLGISRVHLYKVMDAGDIPWVQVGRDRRLKLGDVKALLNERDAASKDLAERLARSGDARQAALDSLHV
ncbi:helix-turn-helix domain-containing protein [Nocardioides pinisoli]|uniref:Helix-turn-helix domain-containing protein n=1 Tax=Nocardioides pinisoli TaxID=2950279 RepID=A0ABT1KY91_9ACTN|nr:helix-turn-helix domain-containing protein [Nocardioides pinisoli]MCP3422728.1 helix-turn-helix domain-containing protein [Nocardioides pinisoli]